MIAIIIILAVIVLGLTISVLLLLHAGEVNEKTEEIYKTKLKQNEQK